MGINPTSEHSQLYERARLDAEHIAEIASACLHGNTRSKYFTTAGATAMRERLHEYVLSRLREERRLARETSR
jgi:hypothetical protein